MAFPGTLNINYYKGDTYEFRIYPKTSSGESFNLSQYSNAKFVISNARGSEGVSSKIEALAVITSGNAGNYVTCTIRPGDSVTMNSATQYVYDVEITKTSSPHNYVYTLLTGNVSVTDQVSGATI
jgi:predicted RNA-binding protein with TRAM domain